MLRDAIGCSLKNNLLTLEEMIGEWAHQKGMRKRRVENVLERLPDSNAYKKVKKDIKVLPLPSCTFFGGFYISVQEALKDPDPGDCIEAELPSSVDSVHADELAAQFCKNNFDQPFTMADVLSWAKRDVMPLRCDETISFVKDILRTSQPVLAAVSRAASE